MGSRHDRRPSPCLGFDTSPACGSGGGGEEAWGAGHCQHTNQVLQGCCGGYCTQLSMDASGAARWLGCCEVLLTLRLHLGCLCIGVWLTCSCKDTSVHCCLWQPQIYTAKSDCTKRCWGCCRLTVYAIHNSVAAWLLAGPSKNAQQQIGHN
jgi:hypothetical protein